MKIDRLFGIVHFLTNGKSTVGQLAEHFGVSKRTVLRDINTLSLSGVPICTTSGNGGGVSLLDGYVLDKAVLSEPEREQVMCGLKIFSSLGADGAALDKLSAVFASADADWIDVDFSRWGATFDSEKFSVLKSAVKEHRTLRFGYVGSDGTTTTREVYPLKIVYKGRWWYVQAYCLLRGGYRTFKINRMFDVCATQQTFDARGYAPPPMDGERRDCPDIEITAVFARRAAYRIYDEFYKEEIAENADGTLTVHTAMPFNDFVYGYLLSFGDDVLRLEPESLCVALKEKTQKMLQTYSKVT